MAERSLGQGQREQRARELLVALRARHPGAVLLRTLGRQYSGEPLPRWSYGLYARRDGEPVWSGPEDRLLGAGPEPDANQHEQLRSVLVRRLGARGWRAAPVELGLPLVAALVFRCDG
ncbi:MAG TPA: transglutaminase family protein, partial [Polyangiaceae bacterium]|nr:transglutaminase family protein [Polyangiaceae bacterium]